MGNFNIISINGKQSASIIADSWKAKLTDYANKMPGRKIINHFSGVHDYCSVIVLLNSGDIAMLYPGSIGLATKEAIIEKIEEFNQHNFCRKNYANLILAYYVLD